MAPAVPLIVVIAPAPSESGTKTASHRVMCSRDGVVAFGISSSQEEEAPYCIAIVFTGTSDKYTNTCSVYHMKLYPNRYM